MRQKFIDDYGYNLFNVNDLFGIKLIKSAYFSP